MIYKTHVEMDRLLYMDPCVCFFHRSFFIADAFKCHSFIITFLCEELSFSQYLMVSLLVKIYFSFLFPENVFIFSLFLKDSFIWNRIYCWQFFSINTWKMLCHFGPPCIQKRNTHWNRCLPIGNRSFLSGCF